jgi:uncharacterized protein YdiU (UPF0061 family)
MTNTTTITKDDVQNTLNLIKIICDKSNKIKIDKSKVQPMLLSIALDKNSNVWLCKSLDGLSNKHKKDGKIIDKKLHDFNMDMIKKVQNNLKHATARNNKNNWSKEYHLTVTTTDNDGKYKVASSKYADIITPLEQLLGRIAKDVTTESDIITLQKALDKKLEAFNKLKVA